MLWIISYPLNKSLEYINYVTIHFHEDVKEPKREPEQTYKILVILRDTM